MSKKTPLPPVSPNLDSVIQIRFKSRDLEKLKRYSAKLGLRPSQFIRSSALAALPGRKGH